MDIKNFKTYEDLAYEVMKKMPSVESTIDIVCFYEDAKQIMRELILTGACTVGNMELYEPEWDGYEASARAVYRWLLASLPTALIFT